MVVNYRLGKVRNEAVAEAKCLVSSDTFITVVSLKQSEEKCFEEYYNEKRADLGIKKQDMGFALFNQIFYGSEYHTYKSIIKTQKGEVKISTYDQENQLVWTKALTCASERDTQDQWIKITLEETEDDCDEEPTPYKIAVYVYSDRQS